MIKMTEEQKEKVMLNGREIMDSLSEGKSARDVMAELYVNNLDNKTLNQGYVMADAIFELSVVAVTIMFGAIIAIPAVLVLLFAICRLAGNEIEEWAKSSEKIVRISSCAIKSIAKGAVAIANFLYENVIKKSVEACKKIFKALKNAISKASDGKAVAKTLPVVAQ